MLAPRNSNVIRNDGPQTKRVSQQTPSSAAPAAGRMSFFVPQNRPQPPQQNRMSMVVQSSRSRASSVIMGGAQFGKLVDRRQLTEKSTQVKYTKKVVQFLTQHGYPNAVSTKTLEKITSKEYFAMVKFLINQYDPNFQYSGKPEEDFLNYLKMIKYPGTIKKSDLSASVAAPMAWPHFLGFLSWMVELLLYDEAATRIREETPEGLGRGDQTEKHFMNCLVKAYSQFLSGSNNFTEELTNLLREKNQGLEEDVQSLNSDIDQINGTLIPLKNEGSRVETLQKKQGELLSDIHKFDQVISDLQGYISALEKKINEQREEIQLHDMEYEKYTKEKAQCALIIEEQESNNIDADRIAKEKAQLEEAMAHANSLRLGADQNTWESESRLKKKLEELEKAVAIYNASGAELSILPSSAKYAEGRDLSIEFQSGTQTLSLDLKSVVEPLVRNLKDKFVASFRKSQEELLNLHEKKERAEEALNDRLEDQKQLQNKHKTLQAAIQAQKDEADAEHRRLGEEVEATMREVQRLKQSSQSSVHQSQKSWQTIEEQYEELKVRYAQERDDLCAFMLSMVDILVSHKSFVQEQLNSLTERFQKDSQGYVTRLL